MSASFVDSVLLLRCDGDQGNPLKHLAPCVWGSDLFVGLFSIAFHSFNSCQIFCGIHIQCCCFFGLKMTQFLPPNLLALFAPRDPIPFLPQLEKLPHEKYHNQPYSGIAPFIRHFEVMETYFIHVLWSLHILCIFSANSHLFYIAFFDQDPRDAPPPTRAETREERLERKVGHEHSSV